MSGHGKASSREVIAEGSNDVMISGKFRVPAGLLWKGGIDAG